MIFELFSNSKLLTRENGAAGLIGCIEELAHKAGATMPKVRWTSLTMPNAGFHPASNTLFITDGMLALMESADLKRVPSKEMRAVLAHEMGHIRFKNKQFLPMFFAFGMMPTVALAGAYFLEKTYARMKEQGQNPQEPKHFWMEFGHVTSDATHHVGATFKDFMAYCYPTISKTLGAKRYQDESWGKTILDEGKIMAITAMAVVPAFAACRPLALHNEWESDRFMLALTQDKETCIRAFTRLEKHCEGMLRERAKTPVHRNFAQKISDAINSFLHHTIRAHPDDAERIAFFKEADVAALAKSFHL